MIAVRIRAVPGQAVTLEDCDPAGWPYKVSVGGVDVTAWPEKYKAGRSQVRARLRFNIPELGNGTHQIVVRDKNGPALAGTVII